MGSEPNSDMVGAPVPASALYAAWRSRPLLRAAVMGVGWSVAAVFVLFAALGAIGLLTILGPGLFLLACGCGLSIGAAAGALNAVLRS